MRSGTGGKSQQHRLPCICSAPLRKVSFHVLSFPYPDPTGWAFLSLGQLLPPCLSHLLCPDFGDVGVGGGDVIEMEVAPPLEAACPARGAGPWGLTRSVFLAVPGTGSAPSLGRPLASTGSFSAAQNIYRLCPCQDTGKACFSSSLVTNWPNWKLIFRACRNFFFFFKSPKSK